MAAVSFSKVTVADCDEVASPDSGVTERELILPLSVVSMEEALYRQETYQKLKKSRTSFSLVCELMPLTWMVLDMIDRVCLVVVGFDVG